MSVPERFDLRTIPPQPWKNGAGLTREIAFGGADAAAFDWRLSVAEVERDAPFSPFPGVDRCITLLSGAGMRLRAPDGSVDHALTTPLVPFAFSGDAALVATLAGGASTDFNVMTRRGRWCGEVSVQHDAAELPDADATLLLGCAGAWQAGTDTLAPLQALLWRAPRGALGIRPADAKAALLFVRLCHDRRP
ncbi:MAG: HutD family protein [Burkholderiales bacterium]